MKRKLDKLDLLENKILEKVTRVFNLLEEILEKVQSVRQQLQKN